MLSFQLDTNKRLIYSIREKSLTRIDQKFMKKITLDELLSKVRGMDYGSQYEYITGLIEKGRIKPMKTAATNGKNPALPLGYWLIEEEKDYSGYIDELRFGLNYRISPTYYLDHLEQYDKDREYVRALSGYFDKHSDRLMEQISLNERSYDIWQREKFLQREQGLRILKNCGIDTADLNFYRTSEPLAYYSASREPGGTVLIIENKDTFYSIRRILIENSTMEKPQEILGTQIDTVIYGAGKGIWKSLDDFEMCVEDYLTDSKDKYLYFGDLDFEGIGIYQKVQEKFLDAGRKILPFKEAYQRMMDKAGDTGFKRLPETKEKQNRNIDRSFFRYFGEEYAVQMEEILDSGKYIPQEILNVTDFKGRD